jgi:hypothetical protein
MLSSGAALIRSFGATASNPRSLSEDQPRARIRARGEDPFHIVKRLWGFAKLILTSADVPWRTQ